MKIGRIDTNNTLNTHYLNREITNGERVKYVQSPIEYTKAPLDYQYYANINFKSKMPSIDMIEYENYMTMSPATKQRYRKLCQQFPREESQKIKLLQIDPHPEYMRIPLQSDRDMAKFIEVAQMYSTYKDNPIICLGRSPKWFLNASLLMKDGIPDYKFVAFSGRWFRIYDGDFGDNRGLVKLEKQVPTKGQERAYKSYLRNIQADPVSIVKKAEQAGKKAIITDYIDSGKGVTSFLDLMSRYAQEQGVLDEFAHSIDLVTIGNNEYRRHRKKVKDISDPEVWMPELLEKYNVPTTAWGTGRVIEQYYYDVDYDVFKQMLLNQNTNECRSTYYPCSAWTVYKPNKFKTGLVKDIKQYEKVIKNLHSQDAIYNFDEVMTYYRNLLNFRILDYLSAKKLLKAVHHTKI